MLGGTELRAFFGASEVRALVVRGSGLQDPGPCLNRL